MKIQILVPSQDQKSFPLEVEKDESVASLRRRLLKTLGVLHDSKFLLIALGKIMLDTCQDGTPARLYSTYRVRDKSSVFVHIYTTSKKRKKTHPRVVIFAGKKRQKTSTIDNTNTITMPFDNFVCPTCRNDTRQKRCADCGCVKCLLKTGDPLICDQCNSYWHLECAGLTSAPKGQYWYCPECYNDDHEKIIGKNEQLETSNSKIIAIKDQECALVPYYHVGKVPGVYVGQTWATRELMAEWGVHRTPSKQMAGSRKSGIVSILLAYGIIEDRDDGTEFLYTGSGGDAKTKGVTRNRQIGPQELANTNLYLALTCNAPINTKSGSVAYNWRDSQPIRICRASTLKTIHPKYAPHEGYRYDGEYKVARYWPHKDETTGNIIWKFLFKRDDTEVPPWTPDGRRLATRRGLRVVLEDDQSEQVKQYVIPYDSRIAIEKDIQNKRLWDQISEMVFWSEFEFLQFIFDEAFACSSHACSKPIMDPITTPCGHICCMKCLSRSKSNQCFTCRSEIPVKSIHVNERLVRVFRVINPAYGKPDYPETLPASKLKLQPEPNPTLTPKASVTVKLTHKHRVKQTRVKPKQIRIPIESMRTLKGADDTRKYLESCKQQVIVAIERVGSEPSINTIAAAAPQSTASQPITAREYPKSLEPIRMQQPSRLLPPAHTFRNRVATPTAAESNTSVGLSSKKKAPGQRKANVPRKALVPIDSTVGLFRSRRMGRKSRGKKN